MPTFEITDLDDDFVGYRYEVEVGNELGAASSGLDAPVVTRRMTTGFDLPFTVRSTIHYETGLDHVILLCSTPIDDVTSLFTFVVWRNDDHAVPAEEVIAFDRAIGAEDKAMLERVPGVLPLDVTATVSVQADRASVEWRRRLAAALAPPLASAVHPGAAPPNPIAVPLAGARGPASSLALSCTGRGSSTR